MSPPTPSHCSAQPNTARAWIKFQEAERPQQEQKKEQSEQDTEKQDAKDPSTEPNTDDKASNENKGQPDLDKAFELKVGARSTRDLDRVADLCESAIEKGLTVGAKEQATQLWASVLYDYAKQLDNQIFRANQDRRWRVYRKEALKRLEKVVELKPDKTDAYMMIARLNSLPGGDQAAANAAIEKAIEQITDDNKTLSEAIFIRATLAEDDEARLADLTQAIKIDPENIDAVVERGRYYLRNDKFDEAMTDFKAWLKTDPKNVPRHMAIAEAFRALKKYDEAAEVMQMAAVENSDDTRVFTILGQIYSETDKNDEALEALTKAVDLDRRNLDALIIRSSILLEKDRLDEALDDANEVLKLEPDSPRGKWVRSIIYGAKKDFADAIKDVNDLIAEFPGNPDFQSQLAMLYNADEQPSKAIEIYDRIIDEDSKDAVAIRGRADAKLSLGQHKGAIEDYEAALKLLPSPDDGKDLEERQKDQLAGVLNNLAWVLATSTMDELRDGPRALRTCAPGQRTDRLQKSLYPQYACLRLWGNRRFRKCGQMGRQSSRKRRKRRAARQPA